MAVTTFAAIDVGSYDISMKIFELSRKVGFRELNDVRFRLEIGHEAYSTGKLDPDMVDAICEILLDFRRIMREFGAEEYRACAHPAYRDTDRYPEQCRAAFPRLQIHRCDRDRF